jgi:hypothetical protein
MTQMHLALCGLLISASPVLAQDLVQDATDPSEFAAISCDTPDLAADLREVCDGMADSIAEVMARPAATASTAKWRVAPKPSLARRAIKAELTTFGLTDTRDTRDPFSVAPDKGVGVRLVPMGTPLEFSTQMVRPGDPAGDPRLNWELKAERGQAATASGVFVGGAAAGAYEHNAASSSYSAFAGVREVYQPTGSVTLGSEITPRLSVAGDTYATSASLEPKLTASSEFDRIGRTGLKGTVAADLGYTLPVQGDGAAYAGFRLALTPR